MSDFFRKHSMITGTLLLTAAGFAVRILGFFYRIFLSRTIGAEGLGLYNLVNPLYGICFALCAGSIQTAISRCIAANLSRRKLFLRTGLMIALSIAALLACFSRQSKSPLPRNWPFWDTWPEKPVPAFTQRSPF